MDYYGTEEGSVKKKRLNKKRYRANKPDMTEEKASPSKSGDKEFLKYMSWMLGLTEGRKITMEELKVLAKELETTPPGKKEESG